MTDSRSESDSTPSKQRGLWSLMGASAPAEIGAGPDSGTPDSTRPPDAEEASDANGPDDENAEPESDVVAAPAATGAAGEKGAPAPVPKQRGLWGMMRQTPGSLPPTDDVEQAASDGAAPTADDDVDVPETNLPKSSPSPRGEANENRQPTPRSLFDLMQHAGEGAGNVAADDPNAMNVDPGLLSDDDFDNDDGNEDDSGDWNEGREDGDEKDDDASPVTYVRQSAKLYSTDDDDEVQEDEVDEMDADVSADTPAGQPSLVTMELIHPDDLEPERYRRATRQARKQVRIGLACGVAAVAASALSLLPNFLVSLPATALGFIAIIAGYLALTGAARREITAATRGVLIFGMLLGTAGIFLGPLLFAGLGRNLRESTGNQATRRHLDLIGEGLDQHYIQKEGYPIGGTFGRDDAGVIRGQHGWMTFLLPYVGESELYRKIDQALPFDDPVNRDAMGRNVNVYFAEGGDRSRIGQGFSVSHFAGLGGEIDEAGGLSHLGIFERDVAVKREEITDGLANTLIVGELAGTYPPWGDPENWRKIGRGLNKDVNGFGSYGGHGASFLLADGSVKFFSNKTDPKLLEKMSTRDGGE